MDVYVKVPSKQQVTINGANVDRIVAALQGFRESSDTEKLNFMEELLVLIKAAESFEAEDLRIMFALMVLREADQR